MSRASRAAALTLAGGAAALLAALAPGCGSSPQGIDACRQMETRCRAATSCPASFGISSTSDVEQCVSFYRDQCLHGLGVTDPGAPVVKTCTDAIAAAGSCASAGIPTLAGCDVGSHDTATTAVTPCDAIVHPERLAECSFLVPPVTTTTDASSDADADASDAGDADTATDAAAD